MKTLREDFTQKEVLSVEQTVANSFNLRNYKDVLVNKVDHRYSMEGKAWGGWKFIHLETSKDSVYIGVRSK